MDIDRRTLPEPLRSFDSLAAELAEPLARVDAARAGLRAARAAGTLSANAVEAVRVELTYHSNAIEGSTLTLRETQLVIEGIVPGVSRPLRELYEARNHDRALRAVERWAADRPSSDPMTADDLLDVHGRVLAGIDDAAAGRLRRGRVLIAGTGFVPPGPHRFDQLLPPLFALANDTAVHPVLRAAELHYNVVAVHPFEDGNGRAARLMANYLLLRHGHPLVVIAVDRRGEYLAALDDANAGRLGPFARFVVDSCERTAAKLLGGPT